MNDTPIKRRPAPTPTKETSRRSTLARIGLIGVGILLLGGMVVQFLPNTGSSGQQQSDGKVVLTVNGAPVTEREIAQAKQQNPLFGLNLTGVSGQDLENLLYYQMVLLSAAQQDSSRVNVSTDDVRKYVDDVRKSQGWADDATYTQRLAAAGYNDATFREAVRKQLAFQKRIEEIQSTIKVSAEEARFFYELNKKNYKNEPRIVARQIVFNDQKTADDVFKKVQAGEDFITLARTYSKAAKGTNGAADVDGAIGAKKGEKASQPVGRIALPPNVADAAFKLSDGQTTSVIGDGGKFYIVKVEKTLPESQQTFAEAKTRVEADALGLKKNAAVENWIEDLQAKAKVVFTPESGLEFYNPTVATVNGKKISLAQLNQAVYSNQQIAQFLQGGNGAQASSLIQGFFKTQAIESLINQIVAKEAAKKLGQPFVGTTQDILAAIQAWAVRDVKVTEAEIAKAYETARTSFAVPAKPTITLATFNTTTEAQGFRAAVLSGSDFVNTAAKFRGIASEYGPLDQNSSGLNTEVVKVAFGTPALTKVAGGEVSGVVSADKKYYVVSRTNFTPESVKPLSAVRKEVEEQALNAKRSSEGQKWLQEQRKQFKITNDLAKVQKALEARAKKADEKRRAQEAAQGNQSTTPQNGTTTQPKPSTPNGSGTNNSGTNGSTTGGTSTPANGSNSSGASSGSGNP